MRGRTLLLVLTIAAQAACTKSDPPAGAATNAAATPSAAAAPSAAPSSSAAPAISASAAPAASSAPPATIAAPAPSATPKSSAAAAPAADAVDPKSCGTKPLPDCPLQGWMKQNMQPPVSAADTAALAVALDKAATFAPAGYTNWASIAKDGARAAKGGDLPAAKQSCRTCHDQYKSKYKSEMRGRKI